MQSLNPVGVGPKRLGPARPGRPLIIRNVRATEGPWPVHSHDLDYVLRNLNRPNLLTGLRVRDCHPRLVQNHEAHAGFDSGIGTLS